MTSPGYIDGDPIGGVKWRNPRSGGGLLVKQRIQRLSGMHDVVGRDREQMTWAIEGLRDFLTGLGYTSIDTPLLEETELFVRKSGGGLTSSLYTFTDPGGRRVSLRPEFTSAAIRYLIEEQTAWSSPIRLQYAGPVFRYEPEDTCNSRQFTQFGAELVGDAGIDADAEILHMAWQGLRRMGIDARLTVGNMKILSSLLGAFELSERARTFILSNIAGLRAGSIEPNILSQRATEAGILDSRKERPPQSPIEGTEAAREYVEGFLSESMLSFLGRRTSEQIVARLVRKLSETDSASGFAEGLSLIDELVQLGGPVDQVLAGARRILADRGIPADVLGELSETIGKCVGKGVPEELVTLDLGLVRGISYYTGVVFTLSHGPDGRDALLGSGGRYDGLVRALGGPEDVPALGFAYNLEEMISLQLELEGAAAIDVVEDSL